MKWSFEPTVTIPKFATNSSLGHKDASCGPIDSKGTLDMLLDPVGGVPFGVGDGVALVLQSDRDTPGDSITLTGIIAGSPVEVDIDGGNPESIKYSFETKGVYVGAGIFANL